jgi:hypothetical protein
MNPRALMMHLKRLLKLSKYGNEAQIAWAVANSSRNLFLFMYSHTCSLFLEEAKTSRLLLTSYSFPQKHNKQREIDLWNYQLQLLW